MSRISFICIIVLCWFNRGSAQGYINTDTVGLRTVSENIYNSPLFGDSLASSFLIVIKKEVKAHKHIKHSEHVVVMEGSGQMKLGDKIIEIKKGDVIFVPKNTAHAVKTTSKEPLKVLSVQAPNFDGKDRVFIE